MFRNARSVELVTAFCVLSLLLSPVTSVASNGRSNKKGPAVVLKGRLARATGRFGPLAIVRRTSQGLLKVKLRGWFGRRTTKDEGPAERVWGRIGVLVKKSGSAVLHERFRIRSGNGALGALELAASRARALSAAESDLFRGMVWGSFAMGIELSWIADYFGFDELRHEKGFAYVRKGDLTISSEGKDGAYSVKLRRTLRRGQSLVNEHGLDITNVSGPK